ncbi:hypothetical protein BMI79_21620 [Serratia oryzae]|uniref:Uncharacterized protein n=1 Tax=Serratia oryzae TaxID=2034155 RepID=A0A1S8CFC6_9GAMM|nr:hypothetical protein BMI79_21620 [Serratia oryzae]
MALPFIPAFFLSIILIRCASIVLMNFANEKKPMKKLFRYTLIVATAFCETIWAGITGVVSGAMTGQTGLTSGLAKRISL